MTSLMHNNNSIDYVLIINPYSSPEYLSTSFKLMKIKTIALYTSTKESMEDYVVPEAAWFDTQIFLKNPEVEDIFDAVKNFKIAYVINGVESSVHLSDLVALQLTPDLANNPKTSALRSDKFLMHKALAKANLNNIQQKIFDFAIDDINDAVWAKLNYPCFIKPLNGVSSHGACKVNDYTELIGFFNDLDLDMLKNKLFLYNNTDDGFKYLICEYIAGDEYIVDTFSYQGKHYISSVQKYCKKDIEGVPIYRSIEIVSDTDLWNKLSNYMLSCLDATEFKNGFAHSELFLTQDNNVVLIEINPRISGMKGYLNRLASLEGHLTQPELLFKYVFNLPIKISNHVINRNIKMLTLFNLSFNPLPDLKDVLNKYNIVIDIFQVKPAGYVHNLLPNTLSDTVGIVTCASDNYDTLNKQALEILELDERGYV